MSSTADVVTVTARGAARLRGGHPWVYAEDVARAAARSGGDVVRVVDGRGATLGTALWAPGARLPLRLLARAAGDARRGALRGADRARPTRCAGGCCPTPTPIAWCTARPTGCPG